MTQILSKLAGAGLLGWMACVATSLTEGTRLAIGIPVALISFILLIISRRALGSSFAIGPEAKVLMTGGPYSRIRHPLYLFLDLMLLGFIVIFGLPICLAAWGVLVIVQTLQSRREEKVLGKAFGEEYDTYMRRTWF